ncbi:ABC transporter permease [Oceanospirillum maris]|uniref:ABC transporter permease n=1 Tax=Oceanospirillum maris TaxID=64977 RepID=UPI0003FCE4FE|nr:FtsX-like permease family protein [Oceanospirillum maris]
MPSAVLPTSERKLQKPKPVKQWSMALKLLLREWRSGDLNLLFSALVLAVMTVALTGFIADRLQRGMEQQAAQLMGGDLVLRSSRAVDASWLTEAETQGLKAVSSLEFTSMVAGDEGFQLSAVKAVDSGYPLKGGLELEPILDLESSELKSASVSTEGALPASGEVWVDRRLLSALDARIGSDIEIGRELFTITRIISKEPDRGGGFMSFNPRALIHFSDVEATGVIQPGSRVRYRYMFAGDMTQVDHFKNWLEERLEPSHRLLDIREDSPSVGSALDRAQRYLQLASIGAVILSGVAVAMAASRFARRRQDTVAVMASLGFAAPVMGGIYLRLLLVLGFVAATVGALLGFSLQALGIQAVAGLVPIALPPAGWEPWVLAIGTGLLLLIGFASAPLRQLRNVSPLRVFRRDLEMTTPSSMVVYGLALMALVVMIYWYSSDARLTLWLTLGLVAVLVLSAVLTLGLFYLLKKVGPVLPMRARLAVRSLYSHKQTALPQVMAFGLVLMVVALVALIRNDLLASWQQQLPENAPNYFAINIQPYEQVEFTQRLDNAGIRHSPLYPIVRGRLSDINGLPAQQAVPKDAREDNALHRELNLTWHAQIPDDNQVIAGRWWPENIQLKADDPVPLSLEAGMAERLSLGLGDTLSFNFTGQVITGEVTNIRQVNWDNFQPNFYVITPPGVLENMPQTLLASFFLPEDQRGLVAQMVKAFPAVSLLDIGQILDQVRQILQQVTMAIEVMLGFTLLSGLVLLLAAVKNSLDERLREGALYRTLGASGRMIRRIQCIEFIILGIVAGVLALLGSELTAFLLYRNLFDLDYSLSFTHWLVLPLSGVVIITAAGLWGTRHVVSQPPLQVLRAG